MDIGDTYGQKLESGQDLDILIDHIQNDPLLTQGFVILDSNDRKILLIITSFKEGLVQINGVYHDLSILKSSLLDFSGEVKIIPFSRLFLSAKQVPVLDVVVYKGVPLMILDGTDEVRMSQGEKINFFNEILLQASIAQRLSTLTYAAVEIVLNKEVEVRNIRPPSMLQIPNELRHELLRRISVLLRMTIPSSVIGAIKAGLKIDESCWSVLGVVRR